MFYDITNQNFCEDCGRDLNSKYNNMRRAKLRLSNEEFNNLKDEMTIKSMDESWVTTVQPPPNAQTEESCLFMLNFNKAGDTLVTSSINIIDIWDFATKEKRKSLTDHVEIVTGLEWLKSPEDNTFISCSLDKTMRVWRDYTCVSTLKHHEDWLRCISISKDNQYLISGCVSSVVWGYDLQKQQPVFHIVNKDGKANLNTINSLDFQQESFVFLSGARDGYIKLYDIRTSTTKPIQEIFSHKMKLNSAVFGQNNNIILSAGRDSTARLWDLRMTKAIEDSRSGVGIHQPVTGYVAEYKGHVSQGYNIASHFFAGDKYVISGSENGYIYIYNTQTAKLVRKIPAGTKVIHLLKPYPGADTGFVYSGLQKSTLHFFDAKTTEDQKPKKELKNGIEQQEDDVNEPAANIIEDFMSENGELILKVFHSNNITYSSGVSFENLIQMILRQNDPDSRRLYTKLNEAILRNMRQFMQNVQNPQAQEPQNTQPKEKPKKTEFRKINEKVKTCQKCNEKEMIRNIEKDSLELNCGLIKNLP